MNSEKEEVQEELTEDELRRKEIEALTDKELKRLPEVREHEHVREDVREDLEAAALGEMTEAEREAAARATAEAEQLAEDKRLAEEAEAAMEVLDGEVVQELPAGSEDSREITAPIQEAGK